MRVTPRENQESEHDVSYIWHSDLDSVLDYREKIEELLGEHGPDLRVVKAKNSNNYGLVLPLRASRRKAAIVARLHTLELQKADLDETSVTLDPSSYHFLYNVSYGLGENLEALKKTFGIVHKQLGSELGKHLVIEQLPTGRYRLVYRRLGDLKSTLDVARKHADTLKKNGIDATHAIEENCAVVHTLANAENEDENEEPTVRRETEVKRSEKSLSDKIKEKIKNMRSKGLLKSEEETSWYVVDLHTGEVEAAINADVARQQASMVKPHVVLAFFNKARHDSKFEYGPLSRGNAERSIQRSSNRATNWLINRLGGPRKVQEILAKYGEIYRATRVVEAIPAGGRTYRNVATASDHGRFLDALWRRRLPQSRELLRLMRLPKRDRIYDGVPQIPAGTVHYNKTGSTARLIGDMGIIVGKTSDGEKRPYAIVGIVQRRKRKGYVDFSRRAGSAIRQISGAVYAHMQEKHGLN